MNEYDRLPAIPSIPLYVSTWRGPYRFLVGSGFAYIRPFPETLDSWEARLGSPVQAFALDTPDNVVWRRPEHYMGRLW